MRPPWIPLGFHARKDHAHVASVAGFFSYHKDERGPPLLQVMPWPDYCYMAYHEVRAI
jgi:hypothetical protein